MTSTDTSSSSLAETDFAVDARQATTVGQAFTAYGNRIRGGDMGALPAVLGLVVLFVVFSLASGSFLTALNMANLITQAGAICVLAMALVPVLLMGDIDLSAGVAGAVAAAIAALAIRDQGLPWYVAVLAAIVAGMVIGLAIGFLVAKVGIPSFVVTLAFFLALQGVTLRLIGQGGSVRVDDPVIRGLTITNVPVLAGWVIAAAIVLGFAALSLLRYRSQVARDLQHQPLGVIALKIVGMAVIVLGVTAVLSVNRSRNPNFPIEGVPYVLPLVALLLIF